MSSPVSRSLSQNARFYDGPSLFPPPGHDLLLPQALRTKNEVKKQSGESTFRSAVCQDTIFLPWSKRFFLRRALILLVRALRAEEELKKISLACSLAFQDTIYFAWSKRLRFADSGEEGSQGFEDSKTSP